MNLKLLSVTAIVALAGCASVPNGPGVMVLPGSGKSFEHFRFDDHECRQYASGAVNGTTANEAAADAAARSAAAGAVVGGLAGAALGGNGNALAAGAALGASGGALVGTGHGGYSARTLQQRYDIGYQQCMYAKGHQIPGAYSRNSGHITQRNYRRSVPPPPPPPPGTPPPPQG